MSINTNTPIYTAVSDGNKTSFTLDFSIDSKEDLKVTVNGLTVSKNDYTFNSNTNSVQFYQPITQGSEITIQRDTSLERSNTYATFGNDFRPESLNYDFNRIWKALQERGVQNAEALSALLNSLDVYAERDRTILDALKAETLNDINEDTGVAELIQLEAERRKKDDVAYDLLSQLQQGATLPQLKEYIDNLLGIKNPILLSGITSRLIVDHETGETVKQHVDKSITTVESIEALLELKNPKDGQSVYVKSYHAGLGLGGGTFIYKVSKATTNDAVTIFNGWERVHNGQLDVVDGGAKPNVNYAQHTEIKRTFEACRTNNILKLSFTKGDYLVGEANVNLGTLIDIWGVTGIDPYPQDGFEINGNGANIKLINGSKFGTFNGINSTTYSNIINVTACKNIKIYDLNIDGNKQNAVIGDKYGDHGWQIPAYGIRLISAKNAFLKDINIKNMLLDGLYIGKLVGTDESKDNITLQNVHSTYNARQALSICGVRGLTATNCSFNYTGQNGLMSAPSAGIDFENELGSISDVTMINCEIRGNVGHDIHVFNLQSDFDIRNVNFYSSTIVAEGKTAYPFGTYDANENKSAAIAFNTSIDFRFHDCLIGGKIMRENGGTNWQYEQTKMVSFNNCTITNDDVLLLRTLEVPKYSQIINTTSPDGTEYGLKLDNCRFKLKDQGIKMLRNGRIHNCIFEMSFTKKLAGHAIDFGTCSLYQNVFYTFDNIEFSNTVNFALWDNTTNRLDSNDAPKALLWKQGLVTGLSGDISTSAPVILNSQSNINDAFTNNDRVFEKRFILQSVNISQTYPEVWGTAIFTHALGGDGTLVIHATNYNGITAIRKRATGVWGDFKITQ